MSIQTFTTEYQDYLFSKQSLFYTLQPLHLNSNSDVFVVMKHVEELINEFEDSVDFLLRESSDITKEIDEIFNSLDNKLTKIDNYSNAIIGLNTTFDDSYNIRDVHPYLLNTNTRTWNYINSYLSLPGISTHLEIKAYRSFLENEVKKKTFYFVLPTNITYSSIQIKKLDINTDISNIEFLNTKKESIKSSIVYNNSANNNVTLDLPLDTHIVIIDTVVTNTSEDITIIPSIFDYAIRETITLEKYLYQYSDYFTLQSVVDTPLDCYIQYELQLNFFDINNNLVYNELVYLSINNNSNFIDEKRNIKDYDSILYVYKDLSRQPVDDIEALSENDIIIYQKKSSAKIKQITEDTFQFLVPNAYKFECIPTIKLYSLTNNKLTPKLYKLTGITKYETN